MGIHYGIYQGVKTYFLHNPELFPAPFEGDDPEFVVKSLVLYGKSVLELFCQIKVYPELFVTNDWF